MALMSPQFYSLKYLARQWFLHRRGSLREFVRLETLLHEIAGEENQ